MSAMPEDAIEETAAGGEQPRGIASPEFFFLLQRMDRLDEKLSARIDQTEAKLSARIDQTETKLSARIDQLLQETKQEISSLKTTMWTAVGVILTAFGIVMAVLLNFTR